MPPGSQEGHVGKRRLRDPVVLDPGGEEVSPQVVDPHKREIRRSRQALGGLEPHEESPLEPRAGGGGDAVQLGQGDVRPLERRAHRRDDVGHVPAARDLRHDAAIGAMVRGLAGHHIRQHAAIGDHRGGGFIAGGFNSENAHLLNGSFPRRRGPFSNPGGRGQVAAAPRSLVSGENTLGRLPPPTLTRANTNSMMILYFLKWKGARP